MSHVPININKLLAVGATTLAIAIFIIRYTRAQSFLAIIRTTLADYFLARKFRESFRWPACCYLRLRLAGNRIC